MLSRFKNDIAACVDAALGHDCAKDVPGPARFVEVNHTHLGIPTMGYCCSKCLWLFLVDFEVAKSEPLPKMPVI